MSTANDPWFPNLDMQNTNLPLSAPSLNQPASFLPQEHFQTMALYTDIAQPSGFAINQTQPLQGTFIPAGPSAPPMHQPDKHWATANHAASSASAGDGLNLPLRFENPWAWDQRPFAAPRTNIHEINQELKSLSESRKLTHRSVPAEPALPDLDPPDSAGPSRASPEPKPGRTYHARWSAADDAHVLASHKFGITLRVLALMRGEAFSTVKSRWQPLAQHPSAPPRTEQWSDEELVRARELHGRGWSYRRIAESVGRSEVAVKSKLVKTRKKEERAAAAAAAARAAVAEAPEMEKWEPEGEEMEEPEPEEEEMETLEPDRETMEADAGMEGEAMEEPEPEPEPETEPEGHAMDVDLCPTSEDPFSDIFDFSAFARANM